YAGEKLVEAGEAAAVRDRHLAWYLSLAERGEWEVRGPHQIEWLQRFDAEHDNLRVALGWATAHRPDEQALRLAAALGWFWELRGYSAWALDTVLGLLGPSGDAPVGPPAARARALTWAARFTQQQRGTEEAVVLGRAAVTAARALGDPRTLCM